MSEQSNRIPDISSATVLVCDDDPDTRSLISVALSESGYGIIEAEDGLHAQQLVQERLPDVIILDVMMPKMTGTEFMQWFRESVTESFVPVLMLTALGDIDDRVVGFSVGVDDYMTKPFNWKELRVRVEALLRVKILTDQLQAKNEELHRMQEELLQKERELVQVRFAGAAAHTLGQPVTSLLLQCRVVEKAISQLEDALRPGAEHAVQAIKQECTTIKDVVDKLQAADPNKSIEYVSGMEIADLDQS